MVVGPNRARTEHRPERSARHGKILHAPWQHDLAPCETPIMRGEESGRVEDESVQDIGKEQGWTVGAPNGGGSLRYDLPGAATIFGPYEGGWSV